MLEINTQSNSNNLATLISLSHAARLTGYHQDYLGQLCRAGKLPASKVGRNWFTSKEAVEKLVAPIVESVDLNNFDIATSNDFVDEALYADSLAESLVNEPEIAPRVAVPTLVQSVTISQVDGLPVAIHTVHNPQDNTNNLQSIITNMRMQSLQKEVVELREMLNRLMREVTLHAQMLQEQNAYAVEDSLKHAYASNMDFGLSGNFAQRQKTASVPFSIPQSQGDTEQSQQWDITITENAPQYSIATWVAATAALVMLVYIATGIYSGSFFGQQNAEVSSVYYHAESSVANITDISEPAVAGESTVLPTAETGENAVNVIQ